MSGVNSLSSCSGLIENVAEERSSMPALVGLSSRSSQHGAFRECLCRQWQVQLEMRGAYLVAEVIVESCQSFS